MAMPSQSLPRDFLSRMRQLLGDEYEAFVESLHAPAARGLRVNSLKISPTAFFHRSPYPLQPLSWLQEGYLIADVGAQPGRHPYHAAGLYYLQDPSAMLAAHLLDPQPGELVLDVSAAPGGKATHLAARMREKGLLVANELIRHRTRTLIENLERFGVKNVLVTSQHVDALAQAWPERFHRVLVDAPCSGEGMFRKSELARVQWSNSMVDGNAARQRHLLDSAAQTVAPGGRLLYATCTFAPEENEAVVAHFLRTHPDFELIRPPSLPGLDPGRPDWIPGSLARGLHLERCIRVWPHRSPGDGHFFALMQRQGPPVQQRSLAPPSSTLKPSTRALLADFWTTQLTEPYPQEGWIQYGEYLHWLPVSPAWWGPIRPVRAGLRVGRMTRGHFLPHHALALTLHADQAQHAVRFSPDSREVRAYLRGETGRIQGPDGWVLVCVEEFALGWGKRVQGILKNHYPRSLRQR